MTKAPTPKGTPRPRLSPIEAKIEATGNGVAGFVKNEIEESERRTEKRLDSLRESIVSAIGKAKELPDRAADRLLRGIADKHHSELWILGFALVFFLVGLAVGQYVFSG